MLGGGMMGMPQEEPQIDKEEVFTECDSLINSIEQRIHEYEKLSTSILEEDFSKLEDIVDFDLINKEIAEKNGENEEKDLNDPTDNSNWDPKLDITMREKFQKYEKLMSLIESHEQQKTDVNQLIENLPDDSVCKRYNKTLQDSINYKLDKHMKMQRLLRKQYIDYLKEEDKNNKENK